MIVALAACAFKSWWCSMRASEAAAFIPVTALRHARVRAPDAGSCQTGCGHHAIRSVLPPSAILVPVFERLFQVKLHGVNQLPAGATDHHLVTAKI